MSEFLNYRIALIPDEELIKRGEELAEEIAELDKTYFRIGAGGNIPHITLYNAEYPEENAPKIFKTVKEFSEEATRARLIFRGFFSEWGWLGLDFEKTREIYNIHEKIVYLLNPLREGRLEESHRKIIESPDYTNRQKENVRQYGYLLAMSEYHPHMTLTRFENHGRADELKKLYDLRELSIPDGLVETVAITQGGEHGTATRLLVKFELKK